jgi:hypothetical protein
LRRFNCCEQRRLELRRYFSKAAAVKKGIGKAGVARLLSVECLIDRGPAHSFFDDDSILCHSSTLTEVSNYPRICEENISGAAAGSRSLSHAEVELLSSNVSARHTERGRANMLIC